MDFSCALTIAGSCCFSLQFLSSLAEELRLQWSGHDCYINFTGLEGIIGVGNCARFKFRNLTNTDSVYFNKVNIYFYTKLQF